MNTVFSTYKGINPSTPEGYSAFMGAIKAAMSRPYNELNGLRAKIKELATANQFPANIDQMFAKFKVGRGEIDMSWLTIFDEVDLTTTNLSSYKIVDVQNGVTFKQVRQGEKAELYSLTGQEANISFGNFGAGLQILQEWYEDQRWWDIEEAVEDYNLAWWEDMATIMFAMIESLDDGLYDGTSTGLTTADGYAPIGIKYDSAGSTVLEKDINTINAGTISLLNANKTTLKLNASSPLVLLCNIGKYDRCRAAISRIRSDLYTGREVINKNITVVPTLSLTKTAEWTGTSAQDLPAAETPLGYLCVPAKKNKYLKRKALTIYPTEFKADSYSNLIYAWGRYGAYVNAEQVRRLYGTADA